MATRTPDARTEALKDVSYAILGMLSLGARSGYEIKRAVDRLVPHFFAISPPQVYGELKMLEAAGLVRGWEDPTNRRKRRLYEMTSGGHEALARWFEAPVELSLEIRDNGLLRLFFADLVDNDTAMLLLEAIRERSQRAIEHFEREIQPATESIRDELGYRFPELTTRIGGDFHRWMTVWCDQIQRALLEQKGSS